MLKAHTFSTHTVIEATADTAYVEPNIERTVQEAWDAECKRRGGDVFDGKVFSVSDISPGRISGQFVPYRYLIAQRHHPDLYDNLRVRSLAVSGVLHCVSGVVFGKRHSGVTQDSGMWELAPSGGVGPGCVDEDGKVDLILQLSEELVEELGIEMSAISNAKAFCWIEDEHSHVIDIGIELRTNLDGRAVQAAHQAKGSAEYEELLIVPENEVVTFVTNQDQTLSPVSRLLLKTTKLL